MAKYLVLQMSILTHAHFEKKKYSCFESISAAFSVPRDQTDWLDISPQTFSFHLIEFIFQENYQLKLIFGKKKSSKL